MGDYRVTFPSTGLRCPLANYGMAEGCFLSGLEYSAEASHYDKALV